MLIGLTAVEAVIVTAFDPGLKSLAAKLALQALLAITLVAVAFIGARPGRGTAAPGELGLRRPRRSPFGIAGLGYLAYIGFAAVYAPLVQPHQKDVTRVLGFGHGHFGAIAAGVLIVAAAPVSEEIFFRGFVFGGLRRRLPFVAAAAISAAIFGIFHYTGPSSLGVVPQLAFLGLVLAFVYERTGSIWPTMAIHIANNALAFAILTS